MMVRNTFSFVVLFAELGIIQKELLSQKNVGNVIVHSCLKIQLSLQRYAQLKMQS